MKKTFILFFLLSTFLTSAAADEYQDTVKIFKNAGESAYFFKKNYAYAIFPSIGKIGFFIGGAHGEGKMYKHGQYSGKTTMSQLSIGLQLGGQVYSQIIFFEDSRAYKEFTSGDFEFGAQASAVVITAGAQASATSIGSSAGASGGKNDANTVGEYRRGMVTFTIAKGGLMYEAAIAGQKFSFESK